MNKKQKEKIMWKRIFDSNIERGNFVRFLHGKVVWKVHALYSDGSFLIRSMNTRYGPTVYITEKDRQRLNKISKVEAFLWIMKNNPSLLVDLKDEEIKEIAKGLCVKEEYQ